MARIVEQIKFPVPKFKKQINMAAYARVSSGKDAMLHSLSAQVSYYNELIQKNPEWRFCGVYADEAITGTKDNRENFQKMLAECRAGNLNLIITKSISRFSRNTVTLLETVRELKDLGVDVYFEEQNIHSLSSDGELMLSILVSYAQEESLSAVTVTAFSIQKCGTQLQNTAVLSGSATTNSKDSSCVQLPICTKKRSNSVLSMPFLYFFKEKKLSLRRFSF